MPRKSSKKTDTPEWKGFVDCNLDKAMKEAAKKWIASNAADQMVKVSELVDDGYKVSFSLDRYHDAYQASMSYQVNGGPNSGYTLSARGPDLAGAVGMLLYKHFIVLEGDWSQGAKRSKDTDPWG